MADLTKVLTDLCRAIVEEPDAVTVSEDQEADGTVVLTLTVAKDDMGKVIGRQGKIARALRQVMKAAAGTVGKKLSVEIRSVEGD